MAKFCDLSVIVPLYNESESLEELHEQISAGASGCVETYEVIYVDDGSDDTSPDVLELLAKKHSEVKVISFRKNYGKSAALAVGFAHASGKVVITMDADLQDDPAEIPHLISKLNEGFDLVSGWKKKRYDPWRKRLSSRVFNFVTSFFTGIRIHDFNCGLKAYRREVVEEVRVYGQLHRFLPVLAHWQGFRIGELIVRHRPRQHGRTKFGPSRFSSGFFDLITLLFLTRYNKRPMHLFGLIGMLMFVAGSIITGYLAVMRLVYSVYLSNRPILFLGILLIIVGIQFLSIGLLSEMITESRKDHNGYSIKRKLGWSE